MINTLRLTHLIYLSKLNKLDVLDVKCLSFNIIIKKVINFQKTTKRQILFRSAINHI